jgi:hypothetical protein
MGGISKVGDEQFVFAKKIEENGAHKQHNSCNKKIAL